MIAIISFILVTLSSSIYAGKISDFFDSIPDKFDSIPDKSLSALTALGDELKDPLCIIRSCINPITFKFDCQCSVVVEAFKMVTNTEAIARLLGFSQEFLDDTLACCPVGTSNFHFLKCMMGCNHEPSNKPICMVTNCKIPHKVGLSNELIDMVAACCPKGKPAEVFQSCFDEMVKLDFVDKDRWTVVNSVNTDKIDGICSDSLELGLSNAHHMHTSATLMILLTTAALIPVR